MADQALLVTVEGVGNLEKGFRKFLKDSGITLEFVMADQLRLWIQDCIRFGPPQKQGKRGPRINRKAGTDRVKKDITKVIVPMDGRFQADWDLNNQLGITLPNTPHAFKTKAGAVYGIDNDLFRPNASRGEMTRNHEKHRRKDGRVTEARGGSESGRNTKDIGRWKFVDKMHVSRRVHRRYVKHRQSNVGHLATGWLKALTHWAVVSKSKPVFPRWILKARAGRGSWTSSLNSGGSGSITATNSVPYAFDKLHDIAATAGSKRQKDISKNMWRRMERMVDRFNEKKAA